MPVRFGISTTIQNANMQTALIIVGSALIFMSYESRDRFKLSMHQPNFFQIKATKLFLQNEKEFKKLKKKQKTLCMKLLSFSQIFKVGSVIYEVQQKKYISKQYFDNISNYCLRK